MAEPTSSAVIAVATASGLTVFGVATGLQPAVLLAGLAGGLLSLSLEDPMPAWKRVALIVMAALVAGYLAPLFATGVTLLQSWPSGLTRDLVQLPVALAIGYYLTRRDRPAHPR